MKYIGGPGYYIATLELTRRNLEILLAKLDDPASARTIIDINNQIAVKAVENEAHYTDREPGEMFMPSASVTRVNVVTPGLGLVEEYWAGSWETHVLDEGRTLSLIGKGDGSAAKAQRDAALAILIATDMKRISESVRIGEEQLASGETPKTLDEMLDEL